MAMTEVSGGGAMGTGLAEAEASSARLREAALAAATRIEGAGPPRGLGAPALAAGAPAYRAMPASSGFTPSALAFAPAEQGYAASPQAVASAKATATKTSTSKSKSTSKASTAKSSTAAKSTKTTAKATSKAKTSSAELAFLDDPRLSIEDKLFQFMALLQQKSDRELTDAMKTYEEKKTAATATSKTSTSTATKSASSGGSGSTTSTGSTTAQQSSGGGGLFGALGDALGGIAKTLVGGAESLVKDLGGPLLAAGCTAVGLPFLAPVALQIGGPLAKSAVDGLASAVGLDEPGSTTKSTASKSTSSSGSTASAASTSAAKSSSSAGASTVTADDAEFDEKLEMMKLQRLVEKQQTMFAALSNVLKAMHESQMAAVNNIR